MKPQAQTVRWLWIGMLVAQAGILLYAFIFRDQLMVSFQTAVRLSGRLSLLLFATLFLMHHRERRTPVVVALFLIFAVAHGIHLVDLTMYQMMKGSWSQLLKGRVGGGFAAYLFIFLTPYMHKLEREKKAQTKSVVFLEYVYLYFIWIVFLFTYLPRITGSSSGVGGSYHEFVTGFAVVIGVMLIKVSLSIRRKLTTT